MDSFALAIHGGAGNIPPKSLSEEQEQKYRQTLQKALDTGYKVLEQGGTSIEAVEATIQVMENSPQFNAGKGAVFTNKGTNEMDASIMNGSNLNAGAVAGVTSVKNPISGARAVLEHSPHVMLAADGADAFAKTQGLKIVDPSYFKTEKRWKQYMKAKEKDKQELDHEGEHQDGKGEGLKPSSKEEWGTVGCVAVDKHGNLAAGTSTGGITNKKWGRIGDSPTIGAGTYAKNQTCAVSCTGHGEFFMRQVAAFHISALMEYEDYTVQQAADSVIMQKLGKQMDAPGGAIAIDKEGNIAFSFNTTGMFRGYKTDKGDSHVAIFKENE